MINHFVLLFFGDKPICSYFIPFVFFGSNTLFHFLSFSCFLHQANFLDLRSYMFVIRKYFSNSSFMSSSRLKSA